MIEAFLKTSVFCAIWLTLSTFCASYDVSTVKRITVPIEISHVNPEERRKRFTSEAIRIPISAMLKYLPNDIIFCFVFAP